jgi:protein-tyrosine-phosphatase
MVSTFATLVYDQSMKILFVCRGNVMRSQFAAAYLRQLHPELDVQSAGTDVDVPGQILKDRAGARSATELALAIAEESGLSIADMPRTQLTSELAQEQDLIIYMTPPKDTPSYLKKNKAAVYWDVPDPHDMPAKGVRDTRDTIKDYVSQLAELL